MSDYRNRSAGDPYPYLAVPKVGTPWRKAMLDEPYGKTQVDYALQKDNPRIKVPKSAENRPHAPLAARPPPRKKIIPPSQLKRKLAL